MYASPPVNIDRATTLVLRAEMPIWHHNIRGAVRFRLTCTARSEPVRRMRCYLRLRSKHNRLLYVVRMTVKTATADPGDVYYRFEDGSARIHYSDSVALVVNPD